MKKPTITYIFYLKLFALVFLISCVKKVEDASKGGTTTQEKEAVSVMIEAESFVNSEGEISKEEGKNITSASEDFNCA